MSEPFYGLATHRIANEHLRIDVLAEAGPRIVRLIGPSGRNMLAEMPDKAWDVPNGTFRIYGGHRLWHAPETFPRTYQPDNDGLELETIPDGVILRRPAEPGSGIAKEMIIRLAPAKAQLTIEHILRNESPWPLELAPWAITQMRSGGTAILPFGPRSNSANNLLPNRTLAFWPYSNPRDPRFSIGNEHILVTTSDLAPTKIGTFSSRGWAAYAIDGDILIKRFTAQPELPHVDQGCNIEVYTDRYQLELETLAPLQRLEPGEQAQHREEWLISRADMGQIDEEWIQALRQEHGLT